MKQNFKNILGVLAVLFLSLEGAAAEPLLLFPFYKSYVQAIENNDFAAAKSHLASEVVGEIEKQPPADRDRDFQLLRLVHVPWANTEFVGEKVSGDRGTLRLKTKAPQPDPFFGQAKQQEGVAEFVRERGEWKVREVRWRGR